MRGGAPADLSGQRFGRLVAIRPVEYVGKSWIWLCKCDCGKESRSRAGGLMAGRIGSCGCKRHGLSGTREYMIWEAMKNRCNNKRHMKYKYYGGQGIKVCRRWEQSFILFLADMGKSPSDKHTIDRKNNSRNYTPSNCRWATSKEQNRNRRNNHRIRFNGRLMCLAEAEEITGVPAWTIRQRLSRGWPAHKAASTPARKMKRKAMNNPASPAYKELSNVG